MPTTCCVFQCTNRASRGSNIKFFRFPAVKVSCTEKLKRLQKQRRKAWFLKLNRKYLKQNQLDALRICSDHFILGKPSKVDDISNPDWIPSVNLGYDDIRSQNPNCEREDRARERETARNVDVLFCQDFENFVAELGNGNSDEADSGIAAQTDIEGTYIDQLEADIAILTCEKEDLRHELSESKTEIERLKLIIKKLSWTEETFRNDNKKLLHFTGISSVPLFLLILSRISDSLSAVKMRRMSPFQKLLLTLMKLRTNISFVGLGYRFGIRSHNAALIFQETIICLEYAFRYVVHWPERDCLRAVMPMCFKRTFGNSVAVIIDCFEVPIERPSTNRAKALTYSDYKHKHTIKYLIGITPQGSISFISVGWGGRVSDKKVTEECGILENLVPGDVVLADRGFTISDVVSFHHASLRIPNFTRGKKQLHPREVENTRKIASVRIHVERVIGVVRNRYKILNGPIPLSILKLVYKDKDFLDYIVRVACILVNLSSGIVPLHR